MGVSCVANARLPSTLGRFDLGHEPCPWPTNVVNLLFAARKVDQETVNNMRSWTNSGPTAAACELQLVPEPEYLELQRFDSQPVDSRELQLVLDPEYFT